MIIGRAAADNGGAAADAAAAAIGGYGIVGTVGVGGGAPLLLLIWYRLIMCG